MATMAKRRGRVTSLRAVSRVWAQTPILAAVLGGCVLTEGLEPASSPSRSVAATNGTEVAESTGAAATPSPARIALLTPNPDAFSSEDVLVYNGDVTQPGLWIVHPAADRARRVRLTNRETGAVIDAAMLRRDIAVKGPKIRVSAAAARALGLVDGHATPVTIEALRYLTAEERAAADEADAMATETDQPEAEADLPSGVIPPGALDHQIVPAEGPANGAPTAEVAELSAPSVQPDEPESEQQPAPDVGGEPNTDEERTGADAVVSTEAGAQGSSTTEPETPGTSTAETEEPNSEGRSDALASAVQAALAALSPGNKAPANEAPAAATSAAPTPDDDRSALLPEPASTSPEPTRRPAVSPADTPTVKQQQTKAGLDRPYLQTGTFPVTADADALASRMRQAKLPVEIRPMTLGTETVSRVLAGPFADDAERDEALKTLQGMGITVAAPVRG